MASCMQNAADDCPVHCVLTHTPSSATGCHFCIMITRDYSFLQAAEFWVEPRNLVICAEFIRVCRILQNSV